jgi:hypothetical protein
MTFLHINRGTSSCIEPEAGQFELYPDLIGNLAPRHLLCFLHREIDVLTYLRCFMAFIPRPSCFPDESDASSLNVDPLRLRIGQLLGNDLSPIKGYAGDRQFKHKNSYWCLI